MQGFAQIGQHILGSIMPRVVEGVGGSRQPPVDTVVLVPTPSRSQLGHKVRAIARHGGADVVDDADEAVIYTQT